MIKFIWINFNYVVCKKPLFLYYGPWCVSWDKQYAVAQDSADFKELIVPCWEVGAPERECRHSDGEQRKTKHSPLAVSKAVTMATSGVASDESPALGTAQKRPSAANSPTRTYSISQETRTRPLLRRALLWLYIDLFSHIHQAYFTGTVAIWRLPQCQQSNRDEYG